MNNEYKQDCFKYGNMNRYPDLIYEILSNTTHLDISSNTTYYIYYLPQLSKRQLSNAHSTPETQCCLQASVAISKTIVTYRSTFAILTNPPYLFQIISAHSK